MKKEETKGADWGAILRRLKPATVRKIVSAGQAVLDEVDGEDVSTMDEAAFRALVDKEISKSKSKPTNKQEVTK